ncbi:MAG TPA: heat-inducible transcriptional repressor HrcA [Candidatus Agathobaculum intestinigallinarum]|nr:heat-inducible transcriptional repressor HrcA [Candidatus Agathobaculum intestinigallinarum]
MELSERKKQILKAIIGDYIRTAEPVGSKALTEGHALPFSSATIRNEMSELEEMGYLEKPHTSAGRIPSPRGYRLYVDELMEQPQDTGEEDPSLQSMMQTKVRELDRLIQEAGRLISSLTNYASVAVTPAMTQISIRQFEIIAVDKMNFVIVVVTDSGTVKNKMVRTIANVSKDEAELLTYVLNQTLTGLPLSHITAERFDIVRRAAGLTALLAPVAEYIAELIEELSDQKVFLEGTNKLLRFPEYRDMHKAQVLLDYMEDDRRHLLPATRKIDGIQFFIGPENGENPLSDTSAIYAKYDIGKIGQGVIGIVGPTRMDYAKLSAQLSRFAKGLNKLIAETFLDEKDGDR